MIHNPERILFAWGQDESEGASELRVFQVELTKVVDLTEFSLGDKINCITPGGSIIELPSNAKLHFTGQFKVAADINKELFKGCLLGFETDAKYSARMSLNSTTKSWEFAGYVKIGTDVFYPGSSGDEYLTNVIIGKEDESCNVTLIAGDYKGKPYLGNFKQPYAKDANTLITNSKEIGSYVVGCFGKHARKFYDAHRSAHPAYQESLLRIANLINSVEEQGDNVFSDYERYCRSERSSLYYGSAEFWTPEYYELFADALEAYLDGGKGLEELILAEKDRQRVIDLAWLLLDAQYRKSISYPVRLHILRHISDDIMHGNRVFGNGLEFMALWLIESISDEETAQLLLSEIKDQNLLENLFRRIDDTFGPDNFTRLIVTLSYYAVLTNNSPPNADNIFVWDDSFINRSDINYKFSFQDDGNLRINVYNTEYVYNGGYGGYNSIRVLDSEKSQIDVDPFSLVTVMFRGQSEYLPRIGVQAGEAENILFVPAIYLMALQTKHVTAIREATIYTTINVGSIFLGVGALSNASRAIRLIAWAETGLSATDIAVIWLENDIKKLNGGDEFLRSWAIFNVAVGVASFSGENIIRASSQSADNFTDFVYGWDKLKQNYRNNPEQLIDAIGPENFRKIEDQARAVSSVEGTGINRAADLDATFTDDLINSRLSAKRKGQLSEFASKSPSDKITEINNIWNTKYPLQEMFEGRTLFEDIMRQYRYTNASGWAHTAEIADNFKGVDFYKDYFEIENIISTKNAVSMKTTISKNVDSWFASAPVQKNIKFIEDGLSSAGLESNGKILKITENAEIHIYMPKVNITETLKTSWMNKLNIAHPKIKFEIKALEDFIN